MGKSARCWYNVRICKLVNRISWHCWAGQRTQFLSGLRHRILKDRCWAFTQYKVQGPVSPLHHGNPISGPDFRYLRRVVYRILIQAFRLPAFSQIDRQRQKLEYREIGWTGKMCYTEVQKVNIGSKFNQLTLELRGRPALFFKGKYIEGYTTRRVVGTFRTD